MEDEEVTTYDFDIGQVAFLDSYIEFLPNKMDSHVWPGDDSIANVLVIFQDRMEDVHLERVGGRLVDESGEGVKIASTVDGVVYVLRCQAPSTDGKLKEQARSVLDQRDVPSWVWAAYHAPIPLYVGGTHRPNERVKEHAGRPREYEGSVFTKIFEPIGLETILVCDGASPYDVEEREAERLEDDPDTFVFQA